MVYTVYRMRVIRDPAVARRCGPRSLVLGPSLQIEYRSIVVPVTRSAESEEALRHRGAPGGRAPRARRASSTCSRSRWSCRSPASLPEDERAANALLDDARALVESHGVRAVTRLERARSAGEAIVADAVARNAELVVIGAPRRGLGRRAPVFGRTVRYVLKHSPCRVIVAASEGGRR